MLTLLNKWSIYSLIMPGPETGRVQEIEDAKKKIIDYNTFETRQRVHAEEDRHQQYRDEFSEYAKPLVELDLFPLRDMYAPDEHSPYGHSDVVSPMPLMYLDKVPHGQLQDEAFLEPGGKILLFEVNEGASTRVYTHGREASVRQYEDLRTAIPQAVEEAFAVAQPQA